MTQIVQGLNRLQRGGGSVIINADGTILVVGDTDVTGTLAVTGQIIGPAGSVGAPSYSFTGDLTTGMYRGGGSRINWTTGGVVGLSLDASGDFEVGGVAANLTAKFIQNVSNVNHTEFGGAIAGSEPAITMRGTDTDIGLSLSMKGTGVFVLTGPMTVSSTLISTGLITATAGVKYGTTVTLTEGAANRLDLAAGDSFNIVSGDLTVGGISTFNDDVLVPTSDVRIGAGSASHSGVTPLFQIHTNISNKRLSGSTYFNDDNAGVIWSLAKSKSDTLGTIVYPAGGDNLGGIWWEGANEAATRFEPGVKVFALAGSTWTATNRESDLIFQTVSSGATALTTILTLSNGGGKFAAALEIDGALNHDGSTAGLYGVTPVTRPGTWIITNDVGDRAFDANATTLDELADVVATLIRDMAALGATGAVA